MKIGLRISCIALLLTCVFGVADAQTLASSMEDAACLADRAKSAAACCPKCPPTSRKGGPAARSVTPASQQQTIVYCATPSAFGEAKPSDHGAGENADPQKPGQKSEASQSIDEKPCPSHVRIDLGKDKVSLDVASDDWKRVLGFLVVGVVIIGFGGTFVIGESKGQPSRFAQWGILIVVVIVCVGLAWWIGRENAPPSCLEATDPQWRELLNKAGNVTLEAFNNELEKVEMQRDKITRLETELAVVRAANAHPAAPPPIPEWLVFVLGLFGGIVLMQGIVKPARSILEYDFRHTPRSWELIVRTALNMLRNVHASLGKEQDTSAQQIGAVVDFLSEALGEERKGRD